MAEDFLISKEYTLNDHPSQPFTTDIESPVTAPESRNVCQMIFRAACHSTLRKTGNLPRMNKEDFLGYRVQNVQSSRTVEIKISNNTDIIFKEPL